MTLITLSKKRTSDIYTHSRDQSVVLFTRYNSQFPSYKIIFENLHRITAEWSPKMSKTKQKVHVSIYDRQFLNYSVRFTKCNNQITPKVPLIHERSEEYELCFVCLFKIHHIAWWSGRTLDFRPLGTGFNTRCIQVWGTFILHLIVRRPVRRS